MSAPVRGERGSGGSYPGRGGMGGNDGAVIERGGEAGWCAQALWAGGVACAEEDESWPRSTAPPSAYSRHHHGPSLRIRLQPPPPWPKPQHPPATVAAMVVASLTRELSLFALGEQTPHGRNLEGANSPLGGAN